MAKKVECSNWWGARPGTSCYPAYHECIILVEEGSGHTGFCRCKCGAKN